MDVALIFFFAQFLVYGDVANDPIHEGWFAGSAIEQHECERLSQATANERYPAEVPPPSARGDALITVDALVCRHFVADRGMRTPRDAAVLMDLSTTADEIANLASATGHDGTTWIVDAYYPTPEIVRKVSSAVRVALAQRGASVSDAPPRVTAGDVDVMRTMPMRDAIPLTCRRLYELGALAPTEDGKQPAYLAVALLHQGETRLHAGVCHGGHFRWLQ